MIWLNQPSQLGKTMCFRGLGDTNRRVRFVGISLAVGQSFVCVDMVRTKFDTMPTMQ